MILKYSVDADQQLVVPRRANWRLPPFVIGEPIIIYDFAYQLRGVRAYRSYRENFGSWWNKSIKGAVRRFFRARINRFYDELRRDRSKLEKSHSGFSGAMCDGGDRSLVVW